MLSWGAVYYRTGRGGEPPTERGSRIAISCPICGAHTDAPVIAFFVTPQSDFRLPNMDMSLYNYLLQCTRCNGPMLMMWPNSAVRAIYVDPQRAAELKADLSKRRVK